MSKMVSCTDIIFSSNFSRLLSILSSIFFLWYSSLSINLACFFSQPSSFSVRTWPANKDFVGIQLSILYSMYKLPVYNYLLREEHCIHCIVHCKNYWNLIAFELHRTSFFILGRSRKNKRFQTNRRRRCGDQLCPR